MEPNVYVILIIHLMYFQINTVSETNFKLINFKMLNFNFKVLTIANNNIISNLILIN